MKIAGILQENDKRNIFLNPFRVCRNRDLPFITLNFQCAKPPDHISVLQKFTAVFSASHIALQMILDNSDLQEIILMKT